MYTINNSSIHGEGIIATQNIKSKDKIGLALYLKFNFIPIITKDLGKKINHSYKPNAYLKKTKNKNEWYLFANQNIKKNEEITINYKDTPWFIDGPMPWYR